MSQEPVARWASAAPQGSGSTYRDRTSWAVAPMRRTIEPRAQLVTSAPDASRYLLGTRSPGIVRSRRREERVPVAQVHAARLDVRDRTTRLPASVESVAEVIGTFVREITPAGPPHPGQRATLPAQSLAAETECASGWFVVHAVASRQPLDKPTDRALVSMRCAPLYGRVLQRRARSIVARGWANASDRQRELSL